MKKIDLYDTLTDREFTSFSKENVSFPEHLHYGAEFVFCLEGEIEVTRETDTYTLRHGEALFFMPYEMHSYKTKKDSKVTIMVFSPEFIDEIKSDDRYTCQKFTVSDAVIDFTSGYIARRDLSVAQIKGLVYPLFCEFLITNKLTISKNEYSDVVRKSLKFIEQHYHEEIGLEDVSRNIGCHYVYLSRCFSENTGFSFSTYLNRYRVARSLYLLKYTQDTITDIAYSCGFGSLRNYNRVFKTYMNQTPSVYRTSDHPIY